MALQRTKERMNEHEIIYIDMTRGLDLCAWKKAIRTDVQPWEQRKKVNHTVKTESKIDCSMSLAKGKQYRKTK